MQSSERRARNRSHLECARRRLAQARACPDWLFWGWRFLAWSRMAAVHKWPRARSLIIANTLAVSAQNILVRGQAVEAHRAARVQSAGANANFRAESVTVAI